VTRGIERTARWAVPALLLMLAGLVAHAALTSGHFLESLRWLLTPAPGFLAGPALLQAASRAILGLGVGLGSMLVYASYLGRQDSLPRLAGAVAGLDTLVALLVALAIVPVLLASGLAPARGPGLLFVTLPTALAGAQGGAVVTGVFLAALALAGVMSAVALLEASTALLVERAGLARPHATLLAGLVPWGLGLLGILSFSAWRDVGVLGDGWFDALWTLATRVLPPVGAAGLALFAGRVLSARALREETGLAGLALATWRFLLRWLIPGGLILILLRGLLTR
jgi:neurotransmitter:Na+ symporter, NSS family